MRKDVKSAIADILKQERIEYVFGYTGGHIKAMWKAASDAKIKLILNRQEGNAVYMADGYSRLTKRPSVILATTGSGVTNMVTGLASALLDSIPLVAIGAGVATNAVGKNAVQEGSGRGQTTEQRLIFKASCKQAMSAPSPEAVPDMAREAFRLAMSGRPGPVYLEIPSDFWDKEIEYERIAEEKYKNTHIPQCNPEDSQKIINSLYKAKHPFIIIGEGAEEEGIEKKLSGFLNELQIPFAVSPMAKNYIDEYHPLYLGVPRSGGKKQKVYEYMRKSDFIFFLGDRMQEWEMNGYDKTLIKNAKLAQVEPDYSEIGRVFPVDFSAVGSVSSFICQVEVKEHNQANKLKKEVSELSKEFPRLKRYEDGDGINPFNINNIIEEFADKEATIVCDTGYNKSMAIMKFRTKPSQKFIVADKNGPMGYSVPAALGAALKTRKEVICFVGDGGFQMTLNELGTAMEYGLKVIYVIQNNSGCQMIVNGNIRSYGSPCADTFKNPDYVKLAECYGLKGYKAETTEEFEKIFKEAQKDKCSVIIDAKVDQSKMVWE